MIYAVAIVFMLCFDNGGVHNLLVGSEPTHCIGYLYIRICRFKTLYPTLGGVEPIFCILSSIFYPTFGGVTLYDLCLYYCFYCFLIAGRCSRVCIILFGGLVFADTGTINE